MRVPAGIVRAFAKERVLSRYERYGFFRVALAGLFVWMLIAAHLLVAAVVILATGFAVVFGWRWLGDTLHRRLDQRRHG